MATRASLKFATVGACCKRQRTGIALKKERSGADDGWLPVASTPVTCDTHLIGVIVATGNNWTFEQMVPRTCPQTFDSTHIVCCQRQPSVLRTNKQMIQRLFAATGDCSNIRKLKTAFMTNCFEFRAALEAARMPSSEFAALLKVERSTVWRWFKGEREVPHYAMVALSALAGLNATVLRTGELLKLKVERRHVYLPGQTFKDLALKWHPDRSGRDTTAEMQLVNLYRPPS
jgi:hypothetical protein